MFATGLGPACESRNLSKTSQRYFGSSNSIGWLQGRRCLVRVARFLFVFSHTVVLHALAVQRNERSLAQEPQMKLPPQLLTACEWTMPPLEGGACLPWFLKGGVWAQ